MGPKQTLILLFRFDLRHSAALCALAGRFAALAGLREAMPGSVQHPVVGNQAVVAGSVATYASANSRLMRTAEQLRVKPSEHYRGIAP